MQHRVAGSRVGQNRKLGVEYVHLCIDDHSRAAYVEMLDDETGDPCARFLARAVVWFAQQGITVRRVMTDNRQQSCRSVSAGGCARERTRGVGYRSRLIRQAWQALGLRHLLTCPSTPKTNGKAELFIKTLLQDWAHAVPYCSSDGRNRQLRRWLRHHNRHRPHSAFGGPPLNSRLFRPVNNLAGLRI